MNLTVQPQVFSISVTQPSHNLEYALGATIGHTHTELGVSNYTQESTPTNANDGDFWFKPSTSELKIYEGSAFKSQNINDGYF